MDAYRHDTDEGSVKARMGYPGALKAAGIDNHNGRIDICLLQGEMSHPYCVVLRANADARDMVAGYSGVTPCGDYAAAAALFEAQLEVFESAPAYCM